MMERPSTIKDAHETFRNLRCDDQGNLCVAPPISGNPTQFFLTANGNGTGTYNIIGDYSGATPTDLYYMPTTGGFFISSVLISVSAPAKLIQAQYGNLLALTNGVKFLVATTTGIEIPLVSGLAVKSNYMYAMLTPHVTVTDFSGVAQTLIVEVRLQEDYGTYLSIHPDTKFVVRVQDNFTGLVAHTFGIRGLKHV